MRGVRLDEMRGAEGGSKNRGWAYMPYVEDIMIIARLLNGTERISILIV